MKKSSLVLRAIVVVGGVLVYSSLAHGQQRTFVSGTGNDANPCTSVAAPCRTFQRGHNTVAAGGEVVALTSAGYGTLNITKSVTITGAGVHAAVTATMGVPYGIQIAAPSGTVILRELTITSLDGTGGLHGVRVLNAANVYIQRCVITSFALNGIFYQTNNRLFVTDTESRNNGNYGLQVIAPGGGTASINIDRSRFERNALHGIDFRDSSIEASITNSFMSENGFNGLGIVSSGITRANVAHSTAANNGGDGFVVSGNIANELNIEYSVARGNIGGGMVVDGSTIRVSNSVATNNGIGFSNTGGTGTFATRGNNSVDGNGAPNLGPFVAYAVQ